MRRKCLILCILFVLTLLAGCSIPSRHPESGLWYCEELDMTLDMENLTAQYTVKEGVVQHAEIHIDYGNGIFVEQGTDTILSASFVFKNDTFTLKEHDSNVKYVFTEITE